MRHYQITHAQCEYSANPLGIDCRTPRFTWQYHGYNPRKLPAEIKVVTTDENKSVQWDSGWQRSTGTALIYSGPKLLSCQTIYWKAYTRLHGIAESLAESDVQSFEMGLLDADDWHGDWIRADVRCEAPIISKSFRLAQKPSRARAYICGLGYFELSVNGKRVGDEILQPVWTAFSKQPFTRMLYPYHYGGVYRVSYRTFDLTDALHEGENRIEVLLGNGWYHQVRRCIEGDLWYGDSPVLLLEARIDEQVIASDISWNWRESAIVRNNIFYGETVNLARGSGTQQPVALAPPPQGTLCAQVCPSDQVDSVREPVRAYPADNGRMILDFGQNLSGWVRCVAQACPGDELTLRFAEEITPAGDIWQMDFSSAGTQPDDQGIPQIQTDVFIFAGGGNEEVVPRFCWHGFRYAEAMLMRNGQPVALGFENGGLKAAGFTCQTRAEWLCANMPVTGRFDCDDELLCWFHQTTIASLRSNQHGGVPSDCPHRERLGYTGDGQATAAMTLLNEDACAFLGKWMQDIFDAQHRGTGHVPHSAPFYNGGGGPGGWGGAVVFVPWTLYRHTGDVRLLDKAWPHMLQYMEYLDAHSENGLLVREEEGGWCLGEWNTPDTVTVDPVLVNTAMVLKMLEYMQKIAEIRGWNDAIPALLHKAAIRRQAFRDAFRQNDGHYGTGGQGSEAFALWANAVDEEEKTRVLQAIVADLAARDWHLDTGYFGTPILLDVLSVNGYAQEAYRLMTAKGAPSFHWMREQGATTLYEDWRGGSHNHPAYGAADVWLYEYAAGLAQAPDSIGWQKIVYRPGLFPLCYASAGVDTPLGRCSISWRRQGGVLRITAKTPMLADAVMVFPDGKTTALPSGPVTLEYDLELQTVDFI